MPGSSFDGPHGQLMFCQFIACCLVWSSVLEEFHAKPMEIYSHYNYRKRQWYQEAVIPDAEVENRKLKRISTLPMPIGDIKKNQKGP